jgi:tripartite-type tricarboxylate transporter receptor subunit TctC
MPVLQGATRRSFIGAAAAFALAPGYAQEFPGAPIQIICPSAPGGGSDRLARLFGRELEKLAGQPVVVVNRVGGGALLGTRAALTAKPDGHTLLLHASSAIVGNAYTVKDAGYDPTKDLVPIASISQVGFALTVNAKSPVKTVAELTAHLKQKKGQAFYASANNAMALVTELYKQAVGVEADRVNYKATTEAILALSSDPNIDFSFVDMTLASLQARGGRVRILAVTSDRRVPSEPEVPTMAEAGLPGFQYATFLGVWSPKDTPRPAAQKLSQWFQQIGQREDIKQALVRDGFEPLPGAADLLGRMVDEDARRWAAFVKSGKLEVN